MTHSQIHTSKPKRAAHHRLARFFYIAASAILLLLTFWGFSRFYLHGMAYPGREIPPPIRTLVITHGIAMSAWILLMLAQPTLVARSNYRLHMKLGVAGAALAAVILVSGIWLAISATEIMPAETIIWSLPPKPFMAVPFVSIMLFGGFVTLGVINRRKPQIHRAMMLLATLAVVPAAVSRIDFFNGYYLGTMWERLFGPFFVSAILAMLLFAARCALTRSFDRVYAMGTAFLLLASVGIMQLARTDAWVWFADMLVR